MLCLRRLLIGVSVLTLTLVVSPLRAQEIDCTNLSFVKLTALLTEAQAKSASGDKDGALELAAQVQAELARMQELCVTTNADLALSETYADKVFSFNYPTGFEIADDKHEMFREEVGFSYVVITNDQSILEAIRGSSPLAAKAQLIAVGVGTADATVRSIGAYSTSANYRNLSMPDLLTLVVKGANASGLKFGEVRAVTAQDKTAAIVSFSIAGSNGEAASEAYMMFVKLSEDRVGMVVGVTALKEGEQLEVLVRAVAETVTLKSS
jgi:hypothetical protein